MAAALAEALVGTKSTYFHSTLARIEILSAAVDPCSGRVARLPGILGAHVPRT